MSWGLIAGVSIGVFVAWVVGAIMGAAAAQDKARKERFATMRAVANTLKDWAKLGISMGQAALILTQAADLGVGVDGSTVGLREELPTQLRGGVQ